MRRLGRTLLIILARVITDPIRDGRLRVRGWPPGLAPTVIIGLLGFLAALSVMIVGRTLRERSGLVIEGGSSMPAALVSPMIMLVVFACALLLAGALHAPWGVRAGGIALGLIVVCSGVRYTGGGVTDPGFLLGSGSWLLLLALQLTAGRRPWAWWEPPAVLVLTGVAVVGPVGVRIAGTLTSEVQSPPQLLLQLMDGVSFFAIALTFVAGVALSDVAFRAAVSTAEVVRARVADRAYAVLLALLVVVALVVAVRTFTQVDLVGVRRWVELAGSAGLLVVATGIWRVLDAIADRRGGPGDTAVHQLPGELRTVALVVAVAIGVGGFGNALLTNLQQVTRVQLYTSFPTASVQAVSDALATASFAWGPVQRGVALGVSGVLCLLLAVRAALHVRRGSAELFGLAGLFVLLLAVELFGTRAPWSQDLLSVLATAGCAVLAVVWLVRGRLTGPRGTALATALLLSVAVAHRELIGDPFGVVIGVGGVAVFGLVWNFLTGSDDANADSPTFPRASRVLLVLGNLVLGTAYLAVNVLQRDPFRTGNLEAYVTGGNALIGTPLLLGGTFAVLASMRSASVRHLD